MSKIGYIDRNKDHTNEIIRGIDFYFHQLSKGTWSIQDITNQMYQCYGFSVTQAVYKAIIRNYEKNQAI